jgi:uncharacterized protein with PIN domain
LTTHTIVEDRTSRRHSHELPVDPDEAVCPYCGQPISRKEFDDIRARIEAEERDRIAKVEQAVKRRIVLRGKATHRFTSSSRRL